MDQVRSLGGGDVAAVDGDGGAVHDRLDGAHHPHDRQVLAEHAFASSPLEQPLDPGCRPLANTVDLLDLHGFRYEIVGSHYGAKLSKKIFGYPVRVYQLWRYLADKRIDVAVSQSSFHSPLVARLLGVRSIYMNDNEHALGNVPSFACATRILVPEFLSGEKLRRQLASPRKVAKYPGVKEGIYLWALQERLNGAASHRVRSRPSVYVRPEPWTAQYYKGRRDFLDDVLLGVKAEVDVTVLPGQYLARDAHGVNPGRGYVRMALVPSLEECREAASRIARCCAGPAATV